MHHDLHQIRRLIPHLSTAAPVLVTIAILALLAVGVGWLVYRS